MPRSPKPNRSTHDKCERFYQENGRSSFVLEQAVEVPPFLSCWLPASQDKQNLLIYAELLLTVWKPKGKQKHNCAPYSLNTRLVNKECKESKENAESMGTALLTNVQGISESRLD